MDAAGQRTEASTASGPAWWKRGWFFALLLTAATLVAYRPAWHGGPIWDDENHVVHNRLLSDPDGLKRIWFSLEAPQYYPLVFTSFRLERAVWGLHLTGYHFDNLLLHAASALLVWQLLRRLRVPGARLAAALFALHPVNVETVAWITERKNTLSMVFFLLCLFWYLRFDRQDPKEGAPAPGTMATPPSACGRQAYYVFSLLAFVLALLSKTAVAPLPVVLLLLAWWRRGQLALRDVWRSLPFFAAALVLIPLTVAFEHQAGAELVRHDSFWSRLAGAGWGFWFYLYKAVLPLDLCFVYPRWRIDPTSFLSYVPGLLVVLLFAVCWRYRQGWGRAALFGLGYFLVMLLPALGFVNIYFMRYSLVSDHWQYFAILGPIALAAAALSVGLPSEPAASPTSLGGRRHSTGVVVCGTLLLALGVLSWEQSRNYTDMETLWRVTLERNPRALLALNNLGLTLLGRGQAAEAMALFRKALEVDPEFVDAQNSLGLALFQQGHVKEAIAHYEEAVRLRPDFAVAHNNLGTALRQDGQPEAAVAQFQKAIDISPRFSLAFYNLGNGFLRNGQTDRAIALFRKALALDPNSTEVLFNLALALVQKGQADEALALLRKAVALRPAFADAHVNLANLLLHKLEVDEAIAHYQAALETMPASAPAHRNLGEALLQKGQVDDALRQFQQAAELLPHSAEAQNILASALIREGRLDEAKVHLLKALELQPSFAQAHNNLGLLLLQEGQSDQAIPHFQQALAILPDNAPAHSHLAQALARAGRASEAIDHYRAALATDPGNAYTLNNLAWALATRAEVSPQEAAQAVELAQQADHLAGGQNPSMAGTLAAAYASAGRFAEAVSTARKASELALAQTNRAQASALEAQIKLYEAGVPFRDPELAKAPPKQKTSPPPPSAPMNP